MNKLILDANAFIKEIDFHSLSNHYSFIIHEAIQNEIRDERARTKLNTFPYPLTKQVPSSQMIKLVKSFATQTCDIASLSPVDIEIIALALTIIESQGMLDKLHLQPLKPLEFNKIKNVYNGGKGNKGSNGTQNNKEQDQIQVESVEQVQEQQVQEQQVQEQQEQQEQEQQVQEQQEQQEQEQQVQEQQEQQEQEQQEEQNQEQSKEQNQEEQPIEDSDDSWEEVQPKHKRPPPKVNDDSESSGEDWINNNNINEKRNDIFATQQLESELKIAVLTTDFAMQNVLLQMGIPLISTEGYVIKSARRFILECHVCKTLVRDPTKLFCPGCGNNSLLKVSCSLESDGTIILYRKKNFKVSLRGTQYSIPMNQSKKDKPFIYCEDQLMKGGLQQQLARQKKQEEYRYKKVMKTYENGVGFEDVEFKQPQQKIVVGYGKLNPNDVNDMRKIKRNKKH